MTLTIAVTGANGKLGKAVEGALLQAGHRVVAMDVVGPRRPGFIRVDLTDHGQVADAFKGVDEIHAGLDAVVHLAAIPAPGIASDVETFDNNVLSDFHVVHAARRAGVKKVVLASSETVLGLPFSNDPPFAPLTEDEDTRPETVYSLGKHLQEEMARKVSRWDAQLQITCLRFSNVMDPDEYAGFEVFQDDPLARRWNLWGYVDARDGAQAVERALSEGRPGFSRYIVAAADTVMRRPSADLMAEIYPNVEVRKTLRGNETLLSIDAARADLGYEPRYSWR